MTGQEETPINCSRRQDRTNLSICLRHSISEWVAANN